MAEQHRYPAQMNPNHGVWLVLLACLFWGTTGTAQAFAPAGAAPLAIGAVRLAIGGAALLLWALVRRAFAPGRPWPLLPTLAAAASMAAYQLCFFAAVARTGVAVGTVVAISSGPIFAGLLGWLVRREQPGWAWAAATTLALLGCVMLSVGTLSVAPLSVGSDSVRADLTGVLLALGAGAAYATYVVASKGLIEVQRPETATGVVFALGALLLLPLFFTQNFGWLAQPRGLGVALHLGLLATALAYTLFAQGLTTTPVATAVTLTLGEPLTATLLGVLLLGERLSGRAALGIGLLLAGLLLLALTMRGRRTGKIQPRAALS